MANNQQRQPKTIKRDPQQTEADAIVEITSAWFVLAGSPLRAAGTVAVLALKLTGTAKHPWLKRRHSFWLRLCPDARHGRVVESDRGWIQRTNLD
jgi:hypothetical protein